MRRLPIGLTFALLAPLLLMAVAVVSAANLTGTVPCSLEARSYSNDGTWVESPSGTVPEGAIVLDEGVLQGVSTEGTQQDPFDIAWDGRIDFRFQTGETVFENNDWAVYAFGVPIAILSGSDDNPGDLDEIGKVEIPQGLPRIVGTVYVSGWLEGNDGAARCDGNGWVRIVGDPIGTVPWIVMILLILIGAAFLIATPYTVDWEEGQRTPWEGNVPGPRPEG